LVVICGSHAGIGVLRKYSIPVDLAVTTSFGRSPWHYERIVNLLKIASLLVEDAFRCLLLLFRSAEALRAENLFLRRQLALTSSAVAGRSGSTRLPASDWRYWQGSSIGAARWWSCSRGR
jgi:hypothetical protein